MVQKSNKLKPVIVITGPTASGKSSVALNLAKKIDGEIICADSMQIYKEMIIGTASPSKEDKRSVKHHLYGFISPDVNFSVAEYSKIATNTINSILKLGKTPILCGGTGQYLSALIKGLDFVKIPIDGKLRETLQTECDEFGTKFMLDKLHSLDPKTAKFLHYNDRKRIIRALEINILTGKTKEQIAEESLQKGPDFKFYSFCINHQRNILYERINTRVDLMIQSGLIDEVKGLLEKYPNISSSASQAIGYKEFFDYFDEKIDLDEAVDKIKQRSRNYAKRQLTWFRKMDDLTWLEDMSCAKITDFIINESKL